MQDAAGGEVADGEVAEAAALEEDEPTAGPGADEPGAASAPREVVDAGLRRHGDEGQLGRDLAVVALLEAAGADLGVP